LELEIKLDKKKIELTQLNLIVTEQEQTKRGGKANIFAETRKGNEWFGLDHVM